MQRESEYVIIITLLHLYYKLNLKRGQSVKFLIGVGLYTVHSVKYTK